MKDDGLGKVFIRHLVMAIPWGIIFLVVLFVAAIAIKQEVKEGMQYAAKTAAFTVLNLALGYDVLTPAKKNVKEGVEFVAKTVKREIKDLFNEPQFKQDLREVFESNGGALLTKGNPSVGDK